MAIIQRCIVMIYGSLQAEFKKTKYNGYIHNMEHLPIFGKIVVYISKPVNNYNHIIWRL